MNDKNISIAQLRKDISYYLDQASKGIRLIVKDAKRNVTIAQITKVKDFDEKAYDKSLDQAAGVFTAENHPEWKTLKDVINWVDEGRKNNHRKF